jgi:Zn-dependent peptidase ImmA (M78 family)/transcriptional regulator with XRE-family HTH domain
MPLKNDPKIVNPQMIILARESRGVSQNELAEILSIKQATISKYENGLLKTSEEDLEKLSKALDYPLSFFLQYEQIYGMEPSEFYHRKSQSAHMKELRKVYAIINIITIHITKLLKSVDIGEIIIPSMDTGNYDSIKDIAKITRMTLKLPQGPVQNVVSTIERAGGIVVYCDFGTNKVDAISRRIPGLPPMFFVNKTMPPDRIRLSLCHELGHIVMHHIPNVDMESEAFKFSGEFLMPSDEIKSSLQNLTLQKLADLKLYWKVSMASLIYRAKALNKVTDNQERYLYSQLAKYGYKTREPVNLDPPEEKPKLLKSIIDLHLSQLKYSKSQLCNILAVHENQFEENYLDNDRRLKLVK